MENAVTARVKAACVQVGLDESATQRLTADVLAAVGELSSENERLRAEIQRYEKVHQEVAMLLKVKSPAHIVHDLRNVLNELTLLKAIAEQE